MQVKLRHVAVALVVIHVLHATTQAQARALDRGQSSVTVRVAKSGMLSAFGHNHEITAPLSGEIDETANTIRIEIRTAEMTVVDPERPESERAEVQRTMSGPEVLDSERFPIIRFMSTSVVRTSPTRFVVTGELSFHGQSRPVTLQANKVDSDHFTASTALKQTDFGIKPVSVGGGTVKVKDEVKLDFIIAALGARP